MITNPTKPTIIYGPIPEEEPVGYDQYIETTPTSAAFLREDDANDILKAWSAYNHSRTWREFWRNLPERFREYLGYPEKTPSGEPYFPCDNTTALQNEELGLMLIGRDG